MKKILLHEDKNLLDEISLDLRQYKPLLEKAKTTYEALEIGSFNDRILKEFIFVGIKQIENNFNENLDKQINNLKVTNSVLKDNLLKGSQLVFQHFKDAVNELKRFKPETFSRTTALKLKFISFNNNKFYLSENDKEEILENDCRIYLENGKELELHKDLVNFIKSFEKVSNDLKGLEFSPNYRAGEEIKGITDTFLRFNKGKYSIIPGSIKFVSDYKERSLKYSQKESLKLK